MVVAPVALVVGSLLEQGLALEQASHGVGAGKRRPPSLDTYRYLRICTDSILEYHTKICDVSTGRRHGDTPKNIMEIWYVYTESGAQ